MSSVAGTGPMTEAEGPSGEVGPLCDRIAKLSEVSLRVTQSLDLDTILQEAADGARSLTGARYGAVGLLDHSGRIQEFITSSVTLEERQLWGDPPQKLTILECLNETQEPLRLAELTNHPRSGGFPDNQPPISAFLGAPIRHLGESVGGVCLFEKEGDQEFSEEDEEILVMLASQTAIAIVNALRHEEERREGDELETERRRLAALVESSPVGVMVVDADTRTLASVNKEGERILGMSPEPGTTLVRYHEVAIYRRTDGEKYEPDERPLARALNHGEITRAEEILLDQPDGGTTMVLVNATPIYSDEGEIVSAVAVIQDMTPLEEVERQRNEFLAMVSHELRTPLTTIVGCTSIVLGRSSRPPSISALLQYFQMIEEQSDNLLSLVDNLLDMTQIQAATLSVSLEPTDVTTVVDEVKVAFLRRGARNSIEVDLPPDLPKVNADSRRIVQVLNNLLSNAAKYSLEASTISVTASQEDTFVAISVTDEGRGILADQLPNLFKKFSRIDYDHERTGTGLGLAICKGIVEAHGGRIRAESDGEGRGTRITFTIPVAVHEPIGAALAAKSGASEKILAVDDDPSMLRLFRNMLSDDGYTVFGTGNPDEMMHLLEMEQPNLILLDLILPGTSGFELMGRIRKVSDVPIIFVSADDQDENIAKALNRGADDYIVKPFSSTELLARVAASLRKRGLADADTPRQPYWLGELTINYADRVVAESGRQVHLTSTEYKLLFELSTNAGRVLTQDQLLQRVWGSDYSGAGHLVRAFVTKLRRKLGDDANTPKYIFTELNVGYRMPKP